LKNKEKQFKNKLCELKIEGHESDNPQETGYKIGYKKLNLSDYIG